MKKNSSISFLENPYIQLLDCILCLEIYNQFGILHKIEEQITICIELIENGLGNNMDSNFFGYLLKVLLNSIISAENFEKISKFIELGNSVESDKLQPQNRLLLDCLLTYANATTNKAYSHSNLQSKISEFESEYSQKIPIDIMEIYLEIFVREQYELSGDLQFVHEIERLFDSVIFILVC